MAGVPSKPLILLLATVAVGLGEDGILPLHATNTGGKPLAGVSLSTLGDGSSSPPTDRTGRTRLRLAPQTRPGQWVSLQVARAPHDLVFISPWDGRVRVPPFENESENFAPLVLAERGDRAALESGKVLASIAAKINAASMPERADQQPSEERRRAALQQVAQAFDLDPEAVHRAVQGLQKRSRDAYERGMSALYQRDYSMAESQLGRALGERERQLRKVPANIVNAAMFLGQALLEQGKYAEAVEAYRKAFDLRQNDPAILNGLGLALLKAGRPGDAEAYLRKALALQQP